MAVKYIISPFIKNIKYIFLKPSIYGGDILSPVQRKNGHTPAIDLLSHLIHLL